MSEPVAATTPRGRQCSNRSRDGLAGLRARILLRWSVWVEFRGELVGQGQDAGVSPPGASLTDPVALADHPPDHSSPPRSCHQVAESEIGLPRALQLRGRRIGRRSA